MSPTIKSFYIMPKNKPNFSRSQWNLQPQRALVDGRGGKNNFLSSFFLPILSKPRNATQQENLINFDPLIFRLTSLEWIIVTWLKQKKNSVWNFPRTTSKSVMHKMWCTLTSHTSPRHYWLKTLWLLSDINKSHQKRNFNLYLWYEDVACFPYAVKRPLTFFPTGIK